MRILVCGDRNWTNKELIRQKLIEYEATTVIEGAARGADRLSGEVAVELGLIHISYPADWKKYGRAAGPIRNVKQFDSEKPDLVLAFHNDIENSKGTKHMVTYARNNFCEVVIVSED